MNGVRHYLVIGGEVLDCIEQHISDRTKAEDGARALAAEIGNVGAMHLTPRGILAVQFVERTKIDMKIWLRHEGYQDGWVPIPSELTEKFHRIRRPDDWELTEDLTGDERHFTNGNSCRSVTYRVMRGGIVLSVPVDPDQPNWWQPYQEDARPLKNSEYWKLVETDQEARGDRPTVYLAGRYSRREELLSYVPAIEEAGFRVQARWLQGGHQMLDDGTPLGEAGERLVEGDGGSDIVYATGLRSRFALDDWEDVNAASVVISFTEPPRAKASRGGRHVEFGVALANKARVIVVGHRENIFHCLPMVEFHATWPEALAALGGAR